MIDICQWHAFNETNSNRVKRSVNFNEIFPDRKNGTISVKYLLIFNRAGKKPFCSGEWYFQVKFVKVLYNYVGVEQSTVRSYTDILNMCFVTVVLRFF